MSSVSIAHVVHDAVFVAAAEAYNHTLERLDNKLSKYIDGNPIRVDGKPRASGIMDTVSHRLTFVRDVAHSTLKIRAAVAHGIKVPPEFEDKHIVDTIVSFSGTLH